MTLKYKVGTTYQKITQHLLIITITTITIYRHHHHHPIFNHHHHLFNPPQPLTYRASPPTFRHFKSKPPPVQNNFNFSKTKTTVTTTSFGELTVDKTLGDSKKQDNLQRQIDDVLNEIPELPKLELSDPLLNILSTEGDDILKLNM